MKSSTRVVLIAVPVTLAIVALAFLRAPAPSRTYADDTHNVSGWAWNGEDDDDPDSILDGGFGWISFNCTNDPFVCASTNYGVHIDINTGVFRGYAWGGTGDPGLSPAGIGWIDFNPSVGCPLAPCEVRADKVTGVVTGWARALSFDSGWDGWISLHCSSTPSGCTSSTYGVTVQVLAAPGGKVEGFAWGGNDTDGNTSIDGGPGWIEFTDVTFDDTFNFPPAAVDDNCEANESIVAIFTDLDVLANCGGPSPDFDPDGDPITIVSVTPLTPLTSGTICILSGGVCAGSGTKIRYTPTPGFNSPPVVTFSYTIADGRGAFASADVTVFVYNCGDGVRQLAEACDGDDFGPSTCQSSRGPFGEIFVGGQLTCTAACKITTTQCVVRPQFDFQEF